MEGVPQVKVTSSEKIFIEFLIDYIVETNAGDMITNLQKVSTHIQDQYPPKHELNLYRKSFGNLKDCVKAEATQLVFRIDGTSFKFQHPNKVELANQAGVLTEKAWARYQEGRKIYLTKQLGLCKTNNMNYCKLCEGRYFVTANGEGQCTKGDAHIPQYDFTKSDDVLECEI